MSYGIAFLGELTFPPGGYAAWLSAEVPRATDFSDWPDGWAPGQGDRGTVDDALAEVNGDFLTFERSDAAVLATYAALKRHVWRRNPRHDRGAASEVSRGRATQQSGGLRFR